MIEEDIGILTTDTPIEVAKKLIYATYEPEKNIISGNEKYDLYSRSELREIAMHLLVYCDIKDNECMEDDE